MDRVRDEQPPEMLEVDESEIISQAELAATKSSMNLSVLKAKPIYELVKMAESMGVEGLARSRKQDIIFGILKAHSRNGENIYGDGVLEILQDGFGFLRSSDGSISPARTTSTCRPARSAASTCAPATPSPA